MGCGSSSALNTKEKTFHELYFLARKIGKGAFASVYVAVATSEGHHSPEVAVKITDVRMAAAGRSRRKQAPTTESLTMSEAPVDEQLMQEVRDEAQILRLLSETGACTRFHNFFVQDGFAYLVMELVQCSLPQWLVRCNDLDEQCIHSLTYGLFDCLVCIHEKAVVHRDIKPDNVLINPRDCSIKLCDFGMAAIISSADFADCHGIHGTPPFMSPEMLKKEGYGVKTDVWSAGVIVHVMLHGEFPYTPEKQHREYMMMAIATGNEVLPSGKHVSQESSDFLKTVLLRDQTRRPTARQAIELDWLTSDVAELLFLGGYGSSSTTIASPKMSSTMERDLPEILWVGKDTPTLGDSLAIRSTSLASTTSLKDLHVQVSPFNGTGSETGARASDFGSEPTASSVGIETGSLSPLWQNINRANNIGAFDLRCQRVCRSSIMDQILRTLQEKHEAVCPVWYAPQLGSDQEPESPKSVHSPKSSSSRHRDKWTSGHSNGSDAWWWSSTGTVGSTGVSSEPIRTRRCVGSRKATADSQVLNCVFEATNAEVTNAEVTPL